MSYFTKFPNLLYNFTTRTDSAPIQDVIVDLTTRINLVMTDQDFQNMCFKYTIQTNELPEHVSYKFYNTPDLAWTILYVNNIGDLASDWPLSEIELNNYIISNFRFGQNFRLQE